MGQVQQTTDRQTLGSHPHTKYNTYQANWFRANTYIAESITPDYRTF